jgi:hypothetical protein
MCVYSQIGWIERSGCTDAAPRRAGLERRRLRWWHVWSLSALQYAPPSGIGSFWRANRWRSPFSLTSYNSNSKLQATSVANEMDLDHPSPKGDDEVELRVAVSKQNCRKCPFRQRQRQHSEGSSKSRSIARYKRHVSYSWPNQRAGQRRSRWVVLL